jgi:hypothetical protein
MWIMKGAFHRPVKEKCHEPDMDYRKRFVFDVAERQQDVTTKFISVAYVLFRGMKSHLQGLEP